MVYSCVPRTLAKEYLLALLKGTKLFRSGRFPVRYSPINWLKARSVILPPTIFPLAMAADVFRTMFSYVYSFITSGSFSKESYSFRFPVIKPVTSSFPFVIVPVLSVNSRFRLPAVSMPVSFRTSTLSRSIFRIFKEDTMAIIRGSPSGTAMTMMITARIRACIKSPKTRGISAI